MALVLRHGAYSLMKAARTAVTTRISGHRKKVNLVKRYDWLLNPMMLTMATDMTAMPIPP